MTSLVCLVYIVCIGGHCVIVCIRVTTVVSSLLLSLSRHVMSTLEMIALFVERTVGDIFSGLHHSLGLVRKCINSIRF